MRFPIDPPQAINVTDNPYEIQQTAGIKALRPLGPSPRQESNVRPHYNPIPEPKQRTADADARKNEDRRQGDRRTYAQPVLVDTRLGRDRRLGRRRPDDPPPAAVDEKV